MTVNEQALAPKTARNSLHRNTIGGLWIIASAMFFTVSMSMVKYLSGAFTAAEQTFSSQVIGAIILLPLIVRHWRDVLFPPQMPLMAFRGILSSLTIMLSFYAYHYLSFADANAISFSRVFFVFPLAVLLLGERLHPAVVGLSIIGFAGVLMIGGSMSGDGSWLAWSAALAAAFLGGFISVIVKGLTASNGPLTLVVWSMGLGAVFSFPFALAGGFPMPTTLQLGLLAVMGIANLLQQVCYIRGLTVGDAVAVAPFDYSRIALAVLTGIVLFTEIPDLYTIGGCVLIVGSSLLIMRFSSSDRHTLQNNEAGKATEVDGNPALLAPSAQAPPPK